MRLYDTLYQIWFIFQTGSRDLFVLEVIKLKPHRFVFQAACVTFEAVYDFSPSYYITLCLHARYLIGTPIIVWRSADAPENARWRLIPASPAQTDTTQTATHLDIEDGVFKGFPYVINQYRQA